MTSRAKVNPEVTVRVEALIRALCAPGANMELIAQRAKRLLAWVPRQEPDRMAWLRVQLGGNKQYFDRTMAALQPASAVASKENDGEPQAGPVQTSRRRGHTARRRSR